MSLAEWMTCLSPYSSQLEADSEDGQRQETFIDAEQRAAFCRAVFLSMLLPLPHSVSILFVLFDPVFQVCFSWTLLLFLEWCFKHLSKKQDKSLFFFFFGWLMLSKIVPNRVILYKYSPELKDKVGNIVDMKIYLNTFCFKDFSFFFFWYFKQKVLKHFGWVFPMRL